MVNFNTHQGKVSNKNKKWMDLSIRAGWLGLAGGQNPSTKKFAENALKNLKSDLKQPLQPPFSPTLVQLSK